MTLSDRKILAQLDEQYVCGWIDIDGQAWAGSSNRHHTADPAQTVNTCSGHRNVQMFFMTPCGKVLHCLPGFWQAKDLLDQMKLVDELYAVWNSDKLSLADKNEQFMLKQLAHYQDHSSAMRYGSQLQGFDTHKELHRKSDFVRTDGPLEGKLKTTDQVIHERMAERPFLGYDDFDTENFVKFGQKHYSYHLGQIGKRSKAEKAKEREQAKQKVGGSELTD